MSVLQKAVDYINPFKGKFNEAGELLVDSRPMEAAIKHRPPESIADQIKRMTLIASMEAAQAGAETFEEANDFYVPEDGDPPGSKYDVDEGSPAGFSLAELQAFIESGGDPDIKVGDLLKMAASGSMPDVDPVQEPAEPKAAPKADVAESATPEPKTKK